MSASQVAAALERCRFARGGFHLNLALRGEVVQRRRDGLELLGERLRHRGLGVLEVLVELVVLVREDRLDGRRRCAGSLLVRRVDVAPTPVVPALVAEPAAERERCHRQSHQRAESPGHPEPRQAEATPAFGGLGLDGGGRVLSRGRRWRFRLAVLASSPRGRRLRGLLLGDLLDGRGARGRSARLRLTGDSATFFGGCGVLTGRPPHWPTGWATVWRRGRRSLPPRVRPTRTGCTTQSPFWCANVTFQRKRRATAPSSLEVVMLASTATSATAESSSMSRSPHRAPSRRRSSGPWPRGLRTGRS